MEPVLRMSPPRRDRTAWADKITKPSSASIAFLFSIKASHSLAVTRIPESFPWGSSSNSTISPEAKATVPFSAKINPWFLTSGASKATKPSNLARSSPSFTTSPNSSPWRKRSCPFIKSSKSIFMVVATRLPTSTEADRPKYTPFPLEIKTCPGARMRPIIWLGSAPVIRFKVEAAELG